MGFKGFSAFIKRKKKYFNDIKLHSSVLVVDGNNIASFLYRQVSRNNFIFNGDYDVFAAAIQSFFTMLLDSKIEPLVVLDGGYELRKLNAIQARLLLSTRDISRLRKEKNSDPFLPLLILDVFKEVLQGMQVKFSQSRYEADSDIIELAKCFNCPILSSDSDYYFSDADYIPFSSLNFSGTCKKSEARGYVACKIFSIDPFLADYGGLPDRSFLSLLSLLLGDYMEIKHFKKLYLSLLKDEEERKGFKLTDFDQILTVLFTWLRQIESLEAAVLKIEESVPLQFKRFVRKQLKLLVMKQKNPEPNPMLDFFRSKTLLQESEDLCSQLDSLNLSSNPDEAKRWEAPKLIDCCSPSGHSMVLPEWFLSMEMRGLFSRHVSNIVNLRTVLLWTQLESFDLPSVHTICFPILRVIAGILLSTSKRKRSAPLTCYVRSKTVCDIAKELLVPLYPSDSVPFNGLIYLPLNTRQSILRGALRIPAFSNENIPAEWSVFFLTLSFFVKNSGLSESQKPVYLGAFILNFLLLNLADELRIPPREYSIKPSEAKQEGAIQSVPSVSSSPLHHTEGSIATKSLKHLWQAAQTSKNLKSNLIKTFHQIQSCIASPRGIDRHITHYYAELQSVLHFVTILNSILNFPYPQLIISKSLSGSLIYKLVVSIRKSTSLSDFMDLLAPSSLVRDLFFESLRFVEKCSLCSLASVNFCDDS